MIIPSICVKYKSLLKILPTNLTKYTLSTVLCVYFVHISFLNAGMTILPTQLHANLPLLADP